MLEYIILGFLMEMNMSGYDIKNCISMSTANFYDASYGSIYPALKRLEDKGFIIFNEVIDGGKFKKIYSITERGKCEFLNWMERPAKVSNASQEHLVKSFFYNHLPRETVYQKIAEIIAEAKEELAKLEALEEQIKPHTDIYKMSTLFFGKGYYKFVVEYYEDFLKRL